MKPKILVVGGGGVGGYVAAKLSQNYDVTLYSKSMQSLYVVENGTQKKYNVRIINEPPKERFDIIIFAVKSHVLQAYAKELQVCAEEHTLIYPLLNGIEPYEKLKKLFSNSKVLKGAIYIISNKIAPNTIELKGKGAMIVTDNEKIREIFEKSGIKVKYTQEIDKEIWKKYLFIAATAALTSLYGKTFGAVAKEHLGEFEDLLEEIIRIAKSEGVQLSEEEKHKAIELLKKSPPNAKTSLQLDLEQGNLGEIDNILGYLAKKSPKFAQIVSTIAAAKVSAETPSSPSSSSTAF